jgi:hypothetical protein
MDATSVIVCLAALAELAIVVVAQYGKQLRKPWLTWVRRHAPWLFAGGLVLLIIGLVVIPLLDDEPTGAIESPRPGESVARVFDAHGKVANIPDDEHVWVFVRDGNRLYPHGEVPRGEAEWSVRVNQGGQSEVIALELWRVDVDSDGKIRITQAAGGGVPPAEIPGADRLAVAENLRIEG